MIDRLFSYRGCFCLDDISQAFEDWETFISEYEIEFQDLIVLLAAEDEEVNRYTLRYLAAIKHERRINRVFVIIRNEMDNAYVEKYSSVKSIVVTWDNDTFARICRLYSVYPYFYNNIIVNWYDNIFDSDELKLVDNVLLTKKEVVLLGLLQLEKIPTEDELENIIAEQKWELDRLERMNSCLSRYKPETVHYEDFEEYVHLCADIIRCNKSIANTDKLILFGVMKTSRKILTELSDYNFVAFIDNDTGKIGGIVDGLPVFSPLELDKKIDGDYKIIVTSKYYKEMAAQLVEMGYEIGKQVFIAYVMRDLKPFLEKETKIRVINQICAGERIYSTLRKKYPEKLFVFTPYPGTGDVMLVGMYLKAMEQQHGLKDYIHVVSAGHCKKILELFGESDINVITVEEAEQLIAYIRLKGCIETNTYIACSGFRQIIQGFKEVDFNTEWQKIVFRTSERITKADIIQKPSDDIYEMYNLRPGKTVLLSPYTKSVEAISSEIWVDLAKELQKRGFDVCTNVSPVEKEINGTLGICVPYEKIHDFVNKGGYFIAIRSGLCDVLAFTTARKVIIYPDQKHGNGSMYDVFSIERMGLKNGELFELDLSKDKSGLIQNKILDFITKE